MGYTTHLLGLTPYLNDLAVLFTVILFILVILFSGKWHLGFCHPSYLPTNRGFHSHYGFWNAEEDYWSKRALDWENFYGYDFHENLEITREPAGIYSTEVYAARAEQIIR